MTDEAGNIDPAAEATPAAPEPSLADVAREELGLNEPEATPAAPATTTEDEKGEAQDTLEAAGLSEEEAAKAAQRPEVVQAVLDSDYGAQALDEIINSTIAAREVAQVKQKQEQEVRATREEAYRKGEEDGDWSEFGQMVGEDFQRQKEVNSLRPAIEAEVTQGYDAAFTEVFATEIEAFSEDELASLNRNRYRSDQEWQFSVMQAVAGKARGIARAEFQGQLSELETAAANSSTAARSRELAVPALPGGAASAKDANAGLSIRELTQLAFADEIASLQGE